jgi:hypothetical protein
VCTENLIRVDEVTEPLQQAQGVGKIVSVAVLVAVGNVAIDRF